MPGPQPPLDCLSYLVLAHVSHDLAHVREKLAKIRRQGALGRQHIGQHDLLELPRGSTTLPQANPHRQPRQQLAYCERLRNGLYGPPVCRTATLTRRRQSSRPPAKAPQGSRQVETGRDRSRRRGDARTRSPARLTPAEVPPSHPPPGILPGARSDLPPMLRSVSICACAVVAKRPLTTRASERRTERRVNALDC